MSQATKRRALRRAQWAKRAREYNRFIFGVPPMPIPVPSTGTSTVVELAQRHKIDPRTPLLAHAMDNASVVWTLSKPVSPETRETESE